MKSSILTIAILLLTGNSFAQQDSTKEETFVVLETTTGNIHGSLVVPAKSNKPVPVTLIIAGSGPTDRDCNLPGMKTDAYKLLAIALAKNNIASLRYDKRGIGASKEASKSEADLRFENYVNDAQGWVDYLKKDKRFSSITIIGHSEGSLIGMLSASNANKFISVAGAGQAADKVIREQLKNQPQPVKDASFPILDSLSQGLTVTTVNPMLFSLFRPSVQPYLISWFKYDPQIEIKKLSIPVLIIQGDNDLQVSMEDAEKLNAANPKAKKVIIPGMTHTLKTAATNDRQANLKTYTDPSIPLSPELVNQIVTFILK